MLPETTDKTKGFFRRWSIVDFPNSFNEKKDILVDIPDEEYNNLAKKCIKIIRNVLDKGEFTNDGSIEKREQRYEERSNPIDKFIEEYCEKEVNSQITFEDFFNRFIDYLKTQNYRLQSKTEVGKSLSIKKYDKKLMAININGYDTTKLYILGLKWRYNLDETQSWF